MECPKCGKKHQEITIAANGKMTSEGMRAEEPAAFVHSAGDVLLTEEDGLKWKKIRTFK